MPSVLRGRPVAAEAVESVESVESVPAAEAVVPGAPALPAAMAARREQTLRAVLDAVRFPLSRLVRSVAERLTTQPAQVGLATLEVEVRDVLLALGRDLLTELVRLRGTGYRGHSYVCPCGLRLTLKEVAPLQQRTFFGTITLERAVYAGTGCSVRAHHMPLDAAWALLGTVALPTEPLTLPDPDGGMLVAVAPGTGTRPARLAPAFAAVVAEYGARLPYAEAAGLLERALGPVAHLSPTTVDTYTQAAGEARAQQEDVLRVRPQPPTRAERRAVFDAPAPVRPATAPDTLVISMDGALERTDDGWKEVKLGAVYDLVARRQQATKPDQPGPAQPGPAQPRHVERVPGATTYTATLVTAQDFGRQVLATAQRRGLGWARQVAVLGDGAKWIWKLAARRFPQAVQIVDWYHAHEHLWGLAQLLYGEGTVAAWTWLETLAGELWAAQSADDLAVLATAVEEAWTTPRKDLPDDTPRRTQARHREVTKAVAYFTTNASRLRYGAFRTLELPVGSGVVEGGCQSVLHTRLKRPGACWSAAGAEAMVRARAVLCSDPTAACAHPWDRLAIDSQKTFWTRLPGPALLRRRGRPCA
ncbi:MAG: hypothetical protein HY332_16050 [Chloroflexi bacterium]|nr:hypothetical protein [Chloroflexota bacterium]